MILDAIFLLAVGGTVTPASVLRCSIVIVYRKGEKKSPFVSLFTVHRVHVYGLI